LALVAVLRRRALYAIAAFTVAAGMTYVVLGAVDVSLLPRYTLAFQIGITLLFAWLVTAWAHEPATRTAWVAVAVLVGAAALVSVPSRVHAIQRTLDQTEIRQSAVDGLQDIARDTAYQHYSEACRPRGVVDALAQPYLEYFSELSPGAYSFHGYSARRTGIVVTTQNHDILGSFSLTAPEDTRPPVGFRRVAGNRSWEAAVKDC
jgi:hypothetical protein